MIPYGKQSVDDADIEAVIKVLRGDWLTTGPMVDDFEAGFAEKVNAPHAASCANGTAALHLAAMALELGPGDLVIVPSITFLATANAVRFTGADVVFADVDPSTGLMEPQHAEAALERARDDLAGEVKAIFPVHLAGQCGDPGALSELAKTHGLKVVEDACHAVGSTYETRGESFTIGSCHHSDLATFSFHPVKTMTTGEGGMVTGRDQKLMERVKLLRNHGMRRDAGGFQVGELAFAQSGGPNPWYYEMQEIGYNYRLTDISCALGLSQLQRLDKFLSRRTEIIDLYHTLLAPYAPHILPMRRQQGCAPGWHLFVAHIDYEGLGLSRAEVMQNLREKSIGTQVHYVPVHRQPYYKNLYGELELPGADAYYESCLSLPLFPDMSDGDVNKVSAALASLLP